MNKYFVFNFSASSTDGAWGSVVIKALRYKSDGPGIDSRWCHWIFQRHIPSDRTMALGSTQPLVKMSTRDILGGKSGRCVKLTTSPPSCAESHEIWEPEPPGTLWVTPGLLRDCFTFIFFFFTSSTNFQKAGYINISQTVGALFRNTLYTHTITEPLCSLQNVKQIPITVGNYDPGFKSQEEEIVNSPKRPDRLWGLLGSSPIYRT
jgi:hypothetical protein